MSNLVKGKELRSKTGEASPKRVSLSNLLLKLIDMVFLNVNRLVIACKLRNINSDSIITIDLLCPPQSSYRLCSTRCPNTCSNREAALQCTSTCVEGKNDFDRKVNMVSKRLMFVVCFC